MKHLLFALILVILISGCSKKNEEFKIATVTLNGHQTGKYPQELLSVRFLDGTDSQRVLGVTSGYPANLPLPATLAVDPGFKIQLYKQPCYVQVWGDSSGLIGSVKVNMDLYKIIFPLEMEVKDAGMDVTLSGQWVQ